MEGRTKLLLLTREGKVYLYLNISVCACTETSLDTHKNVNNFYVYIKKQLLMDMESLLEMKKYSEIKQW